MTVNPKSFANARRAHRRRDHHLDRPERLNALTFDVYAELRDTFRALDPSRASAPS